MSTIPPEDPNAPHPRWCVPDRCLADDPRRSDHRSAVISIESPEPYEAGIELSIEQFADEPLESAPRYVVVRIEYRDLRGEPTSLAIYHVNPKHAEALGRALIELAEQAGVAGPDPEPGREPEKRIEPGNSGWGG